MLSCIQTVALTTVTLLCVLIVRRAARVSRLLGHCCCVSCVRPSSARSLQATVHIFTCVPMTTLARPSRMLHSQSTSVSRNRRQRLEANRLGLNASKTQLMWLGLTQLIDRITYTDISVLGKHVIVSESSRHLRVVIDRELSLAAHVTAVCRAGYTSRSVNSDQWSYYLST